MTLLCQVSCIDVVYIICLLIFMRERETCFQSRLWSLTCRLCMLIFESCRTEKHWLHLSQHVYLRVTKQAEAARPVCCPIALPLKTSVHYLNTKICALCGVVCVCVQSWMTIWALSKRSLAKKKWAWGICPVTVPFFLIDWKKMLPPRRSFTVPKYILWISIAARI